MQLNASEAEHGARPDILATADRVRSLERELREIRKSRRAALESEERRVRFSIMGLMPTLVLIMGVVLFVRRRRRQTAREGGQS